jgi:AcrR family transcriptional regulator
MSPRTAASNQRIREERREQILRAALEVFARRGLSATKISDIAATAGISQGLIHHYFSDKESVFTAVVERAMKRRLRSFEEANDQWSSPWDRLVFICERALQDVTSEPEQGLLMLQCFLSEDIPPETREVMSRYAAYLFSNLKNLIREGQTVAQIVAGNPEELAMILMATLQGLVAARFTKLIFFGDACPQHDMVSPRAETMLRLLKA